jgi:hypothetical protein
LRIEHIAAVGCDFEIALAGTHANMERLLMKLPRLVCRRGIWFQRGNCGEHPL